MNLEFVKWFIETLKWPLVVVILIYNVVILIYNFSDKFFKILDKFVSAYEAKDTIKIARDHSFAVAEGAQDSIALRGSPSFFSYLFWWPRCGAVEGRTAELNHDN